MVKVKYTKEVLEPVVAQSTSVMEVLRKLGLKEAGGNHSHIKQMIAKYNLDTSHFDGNLHNKGKKFAKVPIEQYLSNKTKINSPKLRKRLIEEGYKKEQCERCGLKDWMGKTIPLELHHINNNHFDNSLENLQILCPNCHSQQEQK